MKFTLNKKNHNHKNNNNNDNNKLQYEIKKL